MLSLFLLPRPIGATDPGIHVFSAGAGLDSTPGTSDLLGEFILTENVTGAVVNDITFLQSGNSALSVASSFELHLFDPEEETISLVSNAPTVSGNQISFSTLDFTLTAEDTPRLQLRGDTTATRNSYAVTLTDIDATISEDEPAELIGLPLNLGTQTFAATTTTVTAAFNEFQRNSHYSSTDLLQLRLSADSSATVTGLVLEEVTSQTGWEPSDIRLIVGTESYPAARNGQQLTFSGLTLNLSHSNIETLKLRANTLQAFGNYRLSLAEITTAGQVNINPTLPLVQTQTFSFASTATSNITDDFNTTVDIGSNSLVLDLSVVIQGPSVDINNLNLLLPNGLSGARLVNLANDELLSTADDTSEFSGKFIEGRTVTISETSPGRFGIYANTTGLAPGAYQLTLLSVSQQATDSNNILWQSIARDIMRDFTIEMVDNSTTVHTQLTPGFAVTREKSSETVLADFTLITTGSNVLATELKLLTIPLLTKLKLRDMKSGLDLGTVSQHGLSFDSISLPLSTGTTARLGIVADMTDFDPGNYSIDIISAAGSLQNGNGESWCSTLNDFRLRVTVQLDGDVSTTNSNSEQADSAVDTAATQILQTTTNESNETSATEGLLQTASDSGNTRQIVYDEVMNRERARQKKTDLELVRLIRGRILLQVEEHGEAWYVHPIFNKRHYLQDGVAAYEFLRDQGLGISNEDLKRIPIGLEPRFQVADTDGDGLADQLEDSLGIDKLNPDSDDDGYKDGEELAHGYNPLGSGRWSFSATLVDRLRGRILLQVEDHGEAWYLNPADGRRYYMKDGQFAYEIMRFLGLGISNNDLATIELN